MLDKISIRNYKAIREVDLDLTPFTVFIGQNDTGKSSVLECFQLMSQCGQTDPNDLAQQMAKQLRENSWRGTDEEVSLEVLGNANGPFACRVASNAGMYLQRVVDGPFEFSITTTKRNQRTSPEQVQCGKTRFSPNPNQPLLAQCAAQTGDPRFREIAQAIYASKPMRLSVGEMRRTSQAKPHSTLHETGNNLAAMADYLLTGSHRNAVNEMEAILNRAIPSLAGIAAPVSEGHAHERELRFALSGDPARRFTVSSRNVSDGALYLTAFLMLLYTDAPEIILIEEPENGLHPARLRDVVDLLRKLTTGELGTAPHQVILTTHSPVLLNAVEPHEVQMFQRRKDDGSVKVTRMSDAPDVKRLSKDFGTGEMWFLFGEEDLAEGKAE